jgi:hypothetical protein
LLVSEGLLSAVDFDRLQLSAAAGNAWHSQVRCKTASKDGACGIYSQKRLGLQRITVGSFSTADFFQCGTTSKDGVSDIFGF